VVSAAQDDRVEGRAGDFRAYVRFDFHFARSQVKARGAVYAVGVEQRHGGQFELGADCGQFLGQGRAFEKAESRAGVKFDVGQNLFTTETQRYGENLKTEARF